MSTISSVISVEQGGWAHLNLPAIAEAECLVALDLDSRLLRQIGHLLHPERDAGLLDDLKRSMGSFDFGAQYQQQPVADGGNLINWKWLRFATIRRRGIR